MENKYKSHVIEDKIEIPTSPDTQLHTHLHLLHSQENSLKALNSFSIRGT